MSDYTPEPREVAQAVDGFLDRAHRDAEKHTNVNLLDSGQSWTLHALAASIYAMGHRDGALVTSDMNRAQRQRDRDAEQHATAKALATEGEGS